MATSKSRCIDRKAVITACKMQDGEREREPSKKRRSPAAEELIDRVAGTAGALQDDIPLLHQSRKFWPTWETPMGNLLETALLLFRPDAAIQFVFAFLFLVSNYFRF